MDEQEILKFVFEKAAEEAKECDNMEILNNLCYHGLINEQQRQMILSCLTLCDKNRYEMKACNCDIHNNVLLCYTATGSMCS